MSEPWYCDAELPILLELPLPDELRLLRLPPEEEPPFLATAVFDDLLTEANPRLLRVADDPLFLAPPFFAATFLGAAFFGAAFLGAAFFGAAFLAALFLAIPFFAAAFFAPPFLAVAFFRADFFAPPFFAA